MRTTIRIVPRIPLGSITPALAMWPPGEGSNQQNNDNNQHNQSHLYLLCPHSRCAARVWLKGGSGPSAPEGSSSLTWQEARVQHLSSMPGPWPMPIPPGPIQQPWPMPMPMPMPISKSGAIFLASNLQAVIFSCIWSLRAFNSFCLAWMAFCPAPPPSTRPPVPHA